MLEISSISNFESKYNIIIFEDNFENGEIAFYLMTLSKKFVWSNTQNKSRFCRIVKLLILLYRFICTIYILSKHVATGNNNFVSPKTNQVDITCYKVL